VCSKGRFIPWPPRLQQLPLSYKPSASRSVDSNGNHGAECPSRYLTTVPVCVTTPRCRGRTPCCLSPFFMTFCRRWCTYSPVHNSRCKRTSISLITFRFCVTIFYVCSNNSASAVCDVKILLLYCFTNIILYVFFSTSNSVLILVLLFCWGFCYQESGLPAGGEGVMGHAS